MFGCRSWISAACDPSVTGSCLGSIQPPISNMGGYGTDAKSGLVKFANVFIDLITALAGAWLLFTIIWNGYTIIVSQKSAENC